MRACPQIGALINAAAQQEPQLPEWLANVISVHIREMAHAVIENLHEDNLGKAVAAHMTKLARKPAAAVS